MLCIAYVNCCLEDVNYGENGLNVLFIRTRDLDKLAMLLASV